MNIAKYISVFALAAVLFTGCKDTSKDGNIDTETKADSTAVDSTKSNETAANLETASFKIDGMTCPMGCAATIESKLAGMDGVQKAKVDFDKKEATVSFDPGKQSPEKLVETVEGIADGAYKVSDVKSSGHKAQLDQEKEKAKKASKKDKKSGEKKAGCCSADSKTEKKGGCCSADGKKGGTM